MRILYDATPLLMRSAGVKNYHYELLRAMLPLAAEDELRLFPYLPGLGKNDNERSNHSRLGTLWRLAGVLSSNYLRLPFAAPAVRGCELAHITPHLTRPPKGLPWTSMVHDPTPAIMPEFHTPSNIRYFAHFASAILPRLTRVLTPSRAVASDLVRAYKLDPEKVVPIHHGVAPEWFAADATSARATLELPEHYSLYVGSIEPRKNLAALLDAYAQLDPDLRREFPLVIAGAAGWKNSAIHERIAGADYVRLLGYVPADQLPGVYAGASLFVFPSHYEGFGLPVLEAMAAGTPVLTSHASAMPEVVGEAGVLVDPRSVEEIAHATGRVLEDSKARAAMSRLGRERARRFTWEKTAAETLEVLRQAAA